MIVTERDKVIDMAEHIDQKKNAGKRRILVIAVVLILLVAGICAFLHFRQLNHYRVLETWDKASDASGTYVKYGDDLIRYTTNGIMMTDREGNELWSYAYEMNNPVVEVCGDSIVAADIKGNRLCVCNRNGIINEFSTKMPIQAVAVSGQGITACIIRNEDKTMVMCYDTEGNELVEGKASLTDTGYPLGIAISPDGTRLAVSYVTVRDTVDSQVICYDFSDINASPTEKIIASESCSDVMIPTLIFMNNHHLAAIGTDRIMFLAGSSQLKLKKTLEVDGQIRSVLNDSGRLGVIVNRNDGTYSVSTYNRSGMRTGSFEYDREFNKAALDNGRFIFLNGSNCVITRPGGRAIVSGEFDSSVNLIISCGMFNEYLVVRSDVTELIRFSQ